MFIELHMIQNFAPSNLNRDDTGSPKDCEFGGYRRARISSQAIKRAIRTTFKRQQLFPPERLAVRTRRLPEELARRLGTAGKPPEQAKAVVEAALRGLGFGIRDGRTDYPIFLGKDKLQAATDVCLSHWESLVGLQREPAEATGSRRRGRSGGTESMTEQVQQALGKLLEGDRAADLALFGRMLADLPEQNVDAASQVAHALSTHRVSMEFDFYTAVDDLNPADTAGAGMMGTVEFNSACFYRYANVDLGQLMENLGGDEGLAQATLEAFLKASIAAVPTGKQNTFAAHNPPSLVMTVARDRGLWSLANAFLNPVRPQGSSDLVAESVKAMDAYWGKLLIVYGSTGITGPWVATMDGDGLQHLRSCRVTNVDELVRKTVEAADFHRR